MKFPSPVPKCSEQSHLSSTAPFWIRNFDMGTLSSVKSLLKASWGIPYSYYSVLCYWLCEEGWAECHPRQVHTVSQNKCGQQWANLLEPCQELCCWGTSYFLRVFRLSFFIQGSLDSFSEHRLLLYDLTFWKDAKYCGSWCLKQVAE